MTLVLIVLLTLMTPLCAQVRKLHTRDFTRLSQVQVAEQLKALAAERPRASVPT